MKVKKQLTRKWVIALVLVLVIGGSFVAFSANKPQQVADRGHDHSQEIDTCAAPNEHSELSDECLARLASPTVSTCAYELPADQAEHCPEEYTLGATDSVGKLEWPIKFANWAKASTPTPIINCGLLYTTTNPATTRKNIATGLEMAVPLGTPIYAAASGEVVYTAPGEGIVVIKTTILKPGTSKYLYIAYRYMAQRTVGIGPGEKRTVVKGEQIGTGGAVRGAAAFKSSIQFNVWTDWRLPNATKPLPDNVLLNSAQGLEVSKRLEHPMNYLSTSDRRVVRDCKDPSLRPYNVPVSAYIPAPPRTPDTKPDASALWARYDSNPSQREMVVASYCDAISKNMTPKQRFQRTVDRMYSFKPTKARYDASKQRYIDIRTYAKTNFPRNFANSNFPKVTNVRSQVKYFILHFTVSTNQATDGKTQARIMKEIGAGTGYQYYINDTGTVSNMYFTTDQFAYHVLGKSLGAFGVEISACSQDDITGREYEQAIYLAATFMEKYGYVNKTTSITPFVNTFVQGHREYGKGSHADWPKITTDVFKRRLIYFMVNELGYKR